MTEVLNELYTLYKNRFQGKYCYCLTVTFKPDISYSLLHPKDAHTEFMSNFSKYAKSHKLEYVMYPELSARGNFHYHGLVALDAPDYETHEKKMRIIRNYINRRYGRHSAQHILNWSDSGYKVSLFTKQNYMSHTTSYNVVKYITKDIGKYGFLLPFKNF